MKAVICTKYGKPDVLQLKEVENPTPNDNEVCIKIHATAVTASDIFIRSSALPLRYKIPMRLLIGITKPRKSIIGLVLSGEIESIGRDIARFTPGEEVFGLTGFGLGAYAEYTCMKETDSRRGCLARKPNNISHEEATAAAYGGLLAFQYLEKGHIQSGQHVLIYGASGTCGTIAVQLAKYYGAEVTCVCSTTNVDMVKFLGADYVLDYTKEDAPPTGTRYDLVLDAVGKIKTSPLKKACRKALSSQGKYVSIDNGDLQLSSERLRQIKTRIENCDIKPILDKCYKLEDIVDAHRYVEKGHKKGGVAVTVQ